MSKHNQPLHAENTLLGDGASFEATEAFKFLRTNLLFAMAAHAKQDSETHRIVCISSSLPVEGKTTVAANLAISMAENNEKVLLIDADMRKSRQNKLFGVSNTSGLSDLLIGHGTVSTSIVRGVRPNLDLLPAGTIPPNPSELLNSSIMEELLKVFSHLYSFVFIDTPPINVVPDALIPAAKSSGLILVVRPGICHHDNFRRTMEAVELAGVQLLGAVISCSAESNPGYRARRYSYRNRYYKNSYGSYYGTSEK